MQTPQKKPGLFVATWRFFTGAHMDGRQYTNATWTKPGTHPKGRLTWWNSRPRLHRAGIRVAALAAPVGWLWLYVHYHYWTTVVTLSTAPYALHNGWSFVATRVRQGVRVPDHLKPPAESQNVLAELTFTEDDGANVKPAPRRRNA